MRKQWMWLVVSTLVLSCASGIGATETVDIDIAVKITTETGYIDWTNGLLVATGMAVAPTNVASPAQGKLLARRGAIVDAQRQLLETLGNVRIDAETSMINMMANDVVRTKISGLLRGSFIIPDSELWDGEVYQISVGLNLHGLFPLVYESRETAFRQSPPSRYSEYTGLIIDATGLRLVPQVLFDIQDTNGRLIYGAAQAYYEPAVERGLAGYTASLDLARTDPRVGPNPLVIRAQRTGGRYNSTIVVSTADGRRILDLLADTDVFASCRVIVVTD